MKMKLSWINIVFIVFSVLLMGAIFYFSGQTEEESLVYSDKAEIVVGTVKGEDFSQKTETEVDNYLMIHRITIRKVAHVLEYTVLCLFIFLAFSFEIKRWLRLLLAGIISLIYAISDEIHQLFIPGRAGLVSDVLIDLIGIGIAIAFILFVFLCMHIYLIKRQGTKNKAYENS